MARTALRALASDGQVMPGVPVETTSVPLAAHAAKLQRAHPLNRRALMAAPEEINADMLAFWNGKGGHAWVVRQEHTDITLTPVKSHLSIVAGQPQHLAVKVQN